MSSKRRKLDSAAAQKHQLSAIAARKAHAAQQNESPKKQSLAPSPKIYAHQEGEQTIETPSQDRGSHSEVEVSTTFVTVTNRLTDGQENNVSSSNSREQSPEVVLDKPPVIFTTFNPTKDNSQVLPNKALLLKLMPGERLVVLGQYDIEISKGQITVLGALLKASKTKHRMYAAASHSLPVIRCPTGDIDAAVLRLYQSNSGIRSLEVLSPLYGKLWNESQQTSGSKYRSELLRQLGRSTFEILFSSEHAPSRSYLQPIVSPAEWNQTLSMLADPGQATKRIILCGPKSSGKSTFARLLANRLLSVSPSARGPPGVALLDLDPGQPEYSHPGQLSLIHVHEPNFGSPNTHPVPEGKSRLLRAHALGAISPSMDPSLYMSCALDLFAHYRNLSSLYPECPLVINTAGWVLGTGLEILAALIREVLPSEVIYMSQDGPGEVVESLREAATKTPLITLPSQSSEYVTRTAAHLRTMQSMSYFHHEPTSENNLTWNELPLTSIPPWEIKYAGQSAGIIGIMCYGEQPSPEHLAETINGSLLSVVVIEESIAIPGCSFITNGQNHAVEYSADTNALESSTILYDFLQTPSIINTPHEGIPYFNPANAITLDPRHSHTVGTILLRGIDIKRQCLQVLTPISPDVLNEIHHAGKKVVLVSGKLDTPGWAYTEDLMKRDWIMKEKKKRSSKNDVNADNTKAEETFESLDPIFENEESPFRNIPWVERLTGSQGRGIGARVWRVRRDLGKMADGD